MLCKLSLKNIKKSCKDYAIYFFTLILGVAIFYVFNALDSQTVMMDVTSSKMEIIKLMTNMLSGVSVFVSFILGFLIIYASRFLIKRRNKEFGIYLTLGMSKQKISSLLLLETLFIGLISLAIGLSLGIILSQFMSLLVANMFEADLTKFTFVFSLSSCLKTLVYFSIMYLFVMIFNTINISKCKLIDLFASSKRSETIHLKNPYICTVVFLLSSCILGYAYYLVAFKAEQIFTPEELFKPIIMGIVATVLIFWSLSGLLLKIVMYCKKLYYKGLNSFILRQISSKINTTVFSMSIICLMLFVTICVLSSSLSIKNSMTANLTSLAPVDIEVHKTWDLTEEETSNKNIIADSKLSVRESLNQMNFSVDANFTDIIECNIYMTPDILISNTLGDYYEEAKVKYPNMFFGSKESFVRLSDYNKVADLYGLEKLSLKDNEYILVADFDAWITLREEGLKRNATIELLGKNYWPKYDHCQEGFIYISSNHINMGFFVVPDDAVNESIRKENVLIANYIGKSSEDKEKIEEQIISLENHPYIQNTKMNASTKLSIYENSVGLGALVTFIGIYLGIIFLISSAAILGLKELSESSDNKERYRILQKLGVADKMIDKALFCQIAIFFLFPLLLAIIHSIFGIIFCNYILATFGGEKLLVSIIMTSIFIIFIYGGYFLITYICSRNIIKEK